MHWNLVDYNTFSHIAMQGLTGVSGNSYLDLKSEVLLQVLDDHHQKWKFNAQSLGAVCWTGDESCAAE